MEQDYEDIVREWYNRLQPYFMKMLAQRYPLLRFEDANNLYQDAFLAVRENLSQGRVKEDTSWESYIMAIGLNLASKEWRRISKNDSIDKGHDDDDDVSSSVIELKLHEQIRELSDDDALYKNEEALSLLGNELKHTPEPCGSIIRLFYCDNKSIDEIAERMGYKNADTAKAKKSRCMTDLINRVTGALRGAGFDVTPKRWKRNGKN